MSSEVTELARKIWDYLFLKDSLEPSDLILVLGSHDIRLADHAVQLHQAGLAPLVVFSGKGNAFTSQIFENSEAWSLAQRAQSLGLPPDKYLLEEDSTNTEENLKFTHDLLQALGINFQSVILLQTPNMLRRVKATGQWHWPDKKIMVSSHDISFEEASHPHLTLEMLIHEVVGDLQRIKLYPERGLMLPQSIPVDVWSAYLELLERGFTGNLARLGSDES